MNKYSAFFYTLETELLNKHAIIESWFREKWLSSPAPLTYSVDLRNAGFKIAPVDTNLFPAGFNNLNPVFRSLSIQAFQAIISERHPTCKNILIIPENLTRNVFYYQSLDVLQSIILKAGYGVQIGSWAIQESTTLSLPHDRTLTLQPLLRKDNVLYTPQGTPCLVLLNNDLSEAIPDILLNVSQPIDPCPQLGWSTRSKHHHFDFYYEICQSFADLLHFDVWRICPYHQHADDFDTLLSEVETLFAKIEKKYKEYSIDVSPFIILKPDSGTYGRGVITLRSPDDIKNLNKKQKQNLIHGKGNSINNRLFIQEGIPTIETMHSPPSPAEPVLYMLGQYVIGGFYRLHPHKKDDESLNSPGMQFTPLPFNNPCNEPDPRLQLDDATNRFYVYSVIARLSLIAASLEKRHYCEKT